MTGGPSAPSRPIGIFDSGVGGLTVLRHLRRQLPQERLCYLADQAHVPYGSRATSEIRLLAEGITRFLLEQGAKCVVVACNAATAAALTHLRRTFPQTPFVGMEPAVKPAARATRSGQVGVLATPGTLHSARYANLTDRFARDVEIHEDTCAGLVEEIEAGRTDSAAARRILQAALAPMLAAGVDTLVLACTHYPFALPLIAELAGPEVTIIDPAPAVAQQTRRVLAAADQLLPGAPAGTIDIYSSGPESESLPALSRRALGCALPATTVVWREQRLFVA